MKASLKGKYETDKSGAAANISVFASDVKFRVSLTDATFAAGPSLNGLVLAVEKPGSFIVDYNVPKKDFRFQFLNSVRVAGKPLNLNYIHSRGDNRTILDGTLVLDSANKVSANHVLGSRNGKFKYSYLHGGVTTFEPSYDLAKNSWDFAFLGGFMVMMCSGLRTRRRASCWGWNGRGIQKLMALSGFQHPSIWPRKKKFQN
ncbi:outer envelope pore protein 24B chloroplastic [Prunus yedoensis var. nudiflora]|uniref:Outer envelope pore protein 24B chloroplastic n=1 Tax=Prunus yedoensis var. nudiflora TaxID=2094558 RepID=A0A314Z898_PRUYE|nr:outer envelope pore protein 24B chloroplastic [Prunus yedoensis var. nudiflora]